MIGDQIAEHAKRAIPTEMLRNYRGTITGQNPTTYACAVAVPEIGPLPIVPWFLPSRFLVPVGTPCIVGFDSLGQCYLVGVNDGASTYQSAALGDTLQTFLTAFAAIYNAHVHASFTAPPVALVPIPITPVNSITDKVRQ